MQEKQDMQEKQEKIPGCAEGMTPEQFLKKASPEMADFMKERVEATKLSPSFCEALRKFEKTTLVVYAYLDCPDCRAVFPILAQIPSVNPGIGVVMAEWNDEAEHFLEERLGTGRAPTVLALDARGELMEGAFIERPLETHRATAGAKSPKEAMIEIGAFRNGGRNDQVEQDLLKVLNGEKTDVLPYLKK